MSKSKLSLTIFLLSLAIIIVSLILKTKISNSTQFTSPIGTPVEITPQGKSNYQVIGFLPYWQLSAIPYIQTSLLTQLAYFGINIDDNGQVQTNLDDKTKELGLHRISNDQITKVLDKQHTTNGQNTLVIRAMSTPSIVSAIENQNTLIPELINIKNKYNFDGFNIDFEPTTQTDPELATQVTNFVTKLKQTCQCPMSIDIYASAAIQPRIWQLTPLSKIVDYIIVMGYDFYRSNSPQSGPNAPIYGSPELWKYDLNSTLNSIYTQVPPKKIILAIPWYGYQWQTLSNQPKSTTLANTGTMITYSNVQKTILNCQSLTYKNCQTGYDPDALSPFIIYQDNNQWHQLWYDDTQSLAHKYQLVQDRELGGIAIWALGYETPHLELWQQIDNTFFTQ